MKKVKWFKHDNTARNDDKIKNILIAKGAVAKAIYWDLIEMLHESKGRLKVEDAINLVSFENGISDKTIAEYVICSSGLFIVKKDYFFSVRLAKELSRDEEIREKRKKAGEIGVEKRRLQTIDSQQDLSKCSANAQQMLSKCSANAQAVINRDSSSVPSELSLNINNSVVKKDEKDISSLHSDISKNPEDFCPLPSDEKLFDDDDFDAPPTRKKTALTRKQAQQVIDRWNRIIDERPSPFSKVELLTDMRYGKIKTRWIEFSSVGDPIEVCRTVFDKVYESSFLKGEKKDWKASFDWLFKNGQNWLNVYEGTYDSDGERKGNTPLADKWQ